MLEHALQCAFQAEKEGVPDSLVVAALLHDIGHLLHGLQEDIAEHGEDARHEEAGAAWLSERFDSDVVEPVRLHVPAKRYLCAVDPGYLQGLSRASVQSLDLQGGPFTTQEARAFETLPYYREATQLRRWDDAAKIPGLEVPGLEPYCSCICAAAKALPSLGQGA